MSTRKTDPRRGGALLAVLWISAALSAIAFSVANTVRGETERTGTLTEAVRAHYLAVSGVERLLLYMQWGPGPRKPDGTATYFESGMSRLTMPFPAGVVEVEVVPETSKINLNRARPEDLLALLAALGVPPGRAEEIVAAIVDWRTPAPGGLSLFDQYYMSRSPSFRARHASFEEIEELLLVKGMTPDLFYGTLVRDAQGRLLPQPGLKDCVSVYGSGGSVDANTAPPAVLRAIGLPPEAVAAIVQRRHASPFRNRGELTPFIQIAGPAGNRLTVGGGGTIFTVRATAQIRHPDGRLSDLKRSVSALMKYNVGPGLARPFEVLRWYDN